MTTEPKTNRRYGEKSEQALALAKTKKQITNRDLVAVGMESQSASHLLNALKNKGKLRLVRKGQMGRYGLPALYEIAGGAK